MQNILNHDSNQRQLALDPRKSFIVQAPAGSGKTELLIQRFLTLLNQVKKPEEILAITFTRKAANEMRSRVVNALKFAQNEPEPNALHAKKTWLLAKQVLARDLQLQWYLIDNPNQLCIQTIDSLCAFLTRQLPVVSQFGSSPDIVPNPTPLYREAVQEVLLHVEENYAWSEAIAELLLHLDNDLNKLHLLLISLLAKRDQWLPYIQFNKADADIKKQLECHLANVITNSLQSLRSLFPREIITELMCIARFAADQLALTQTPSPLLACRNLMDLPNCQVKDQSAWLGLAKLLLTNDFSWRKKVDAKIGFPAKTNLKNSAEKAAHDAFRERYKLLLEKLREREDLRVALMQLFYLPDAFYQPEQWQILQSLLAVLKIVAAQLRVTFEQFGQIDFIENAQAALVALGSDEHPTDLALTLDYQIQHILVDEFQDTSSTQYQLLEKLITGWEENDGRTLFVVGDPMQSIYRFREAEVGLFLRMVVNGIGNIKLIPVTLTRNFRSTTNIVNWVNHHFQTIFPNFNDMASGAVKYSASLAAQETQENSCIEIKGLLNADETIQAQHVIDCVKQQLANYPEDNIAILVRSRTHLSAIIPLLKRAQIPYHAIDIDPLASRQCTQDLLSLTCALLHPADRIAWLAILRAPWCGLTLSDLFALANRNPFITIWEQLQRQEVLKTLSNDGRTSLARIIPVLKNTLAERGRIPLREWIETTWLLLGGPATLANYTEINDANVFFKLLDELHQGNNILNLERLKERMNQLYASTEHENHRLQIMTIHTAKGLEFDTVILPHLERKMPSDDQLLLAWMEHPLLNDQIALLLAPIHATGTNKEATYEFINRQQKIKSAYETDRLLYVAATRAKKRLFLYFSTTDRESGELKTEHGSFLTKLWPCLKNQKENILQLHELKTDGKQIKHARTITRLSTPWQNPIQENVFVRSPAHQKQAGFQLIDNEATVIGIVTHKILQHLAVSGTRWWQEIQEQAEINYLHYQLSQQGLRPQRLQHAAVIIQKAICNTLNDTRGQWILHAHTDARSEFAINAFMNGRVESLVIDRTFIDEQGIRWIIDYKSTTFTSLDLELFLAQEQEKYVAKMLSYHRAMQLIEDRNIRLGLYFPAIPAWKEWEIS